MKTGTKLGLIIGGIILIFGLIGIAGIAGFAFYRMSGGTERARADYRKQTAETIGTVTNVSLSTASKIYTYKYDVNGVTYTAIHMGTRSKVETDYTKHVGKKATVCYDPSDPNNSDIKLLEIFLPDEPKDKCFGAETK